MKKTEPIIHILKTEYPDIEPLLHYENCFQLMIAVILSAQCTDARVNIITPSLFAAYPNAEKLAAAPMETIERIIHSAGFYKMKAKHLKGASAVVSSRFEGNIPREMDDLLSLPGIGRKSANVIRAHCFGLPAIIVDTHFSRVIRRLGLTEQTNPEKIENEIRRLVPPEEQIRFSMTVNLHGRYICKARKPDCSRCFLLPWCDFTEIQR